MSTYILWMLAASLLGLLITTVFVGVLRLKRSVFLAFYVPLVVLFLTLYVRWTNLNVGELLKQNLDMGSCFWRDRQHYSDSKCQLSARFATLTRSEYCILNCSGLGLFMAQWMDFSFRYSQSCSHGSPFPL